METLGWRCAGGVVNDWKGGTAWGLAPFYFLGPTCKPTPSPSGPVPMSQASGAWDWSRCKRGKLNSETVHYGLLH